jgi:hypothetical protein
LSTWISVGCCRWATSSKLQRAFLLSAHEEKLGRWDANWYCANIALATNHRSEKGLIVSLTVRLESLEAHAEGVLFRCDCGDGDIVCAITDTALRDLIDFYRIKSTAADASRVLLPELERIVNAKCDA